MNKAKIILWGGFWDGYDKSDIALEDLNSHASVCAFFLKKALSKSVNVIAINNFDSIYKAKEHGDAIAIISTFQAGFTVLNRKNPALFQDVKKHFKGKLCSIVDLPTLQRYEEDILFTVVPWQLNVKNIIKKMYSGVRVVTMGWCADRSYCQPKKINGEHINVFLDHGNYAGKDYSHVFIEAINILNKRNQNLKLKVFYQGNDGIQEWELGQPWHFEKYQRSNKVSWLDIIRHYSSMHIFCVTHPESAGLGAIEAAMAGAKLYVPQLKEPFLKAALLEASISHCVIACNPHDITTTLRKDCKEGIDRFANHEKVIKKHDWQSAANNILRSIVLQ